jgi:glycosyltransferase involved in cell wall biosynthesis
MKIAIDGRCLMNGNYSGVGWYAYNLIENLLAIDQSNQYVIFYNSSRPVSAPAFTAPNLEVKRCNYPNRLFNFSLNFFGRPILDRLIGGCDVFFSPNLHFLSLSNQTKSVLAVHDLSFLIDHDFFTAKQRYWHQLILNKRLIEKADQIIVDSNSTKQDLMELFNYPSAKISVVHLGVAEKYFATVSETERVIVRQKYHLPEKFLLSVGTIEPRKNLLGTIKALDALGWPIDLVVAGNYGWKFGEVKKLIETNSRIRPLGYIDEADKPALYQLASGLVYPSYYEGFGLPILEAMAASCPVVAGNNSSQGEVLGDCGLLVDPYNVTEIKRGIGLILSGDEMIRQMADRAKLRAREFSWDKTARQTLMIFENLK